MTTTEAPDMTLQMRMKDEAALWNIICIAASMGPPGTTRESWLINRLVELHKADLLLPRAGRYGR